MVDAAVGPWRPKNKVLLQQWERMQKNAVPLRQAELGASNLIPFSPDGEGIVGGTNPAQHVREEPDDQTMAALRKRMKIMMPPKRRKDPHKLLDGFMLLEACRVEFPDEATRGVVQEKGLERVAAEDMPFFSKLGFLDLGDNKLRFEDLSCFTALQELHLHCNGISQIGDYGGFEHLEILDLSYNALSLDSVAALTKLSKLRELDLTCNALTSLPDVMVGSCAVTPYP